MLPRFCRLCYKAVDESIINLRRYSVRIKYDNQRVASERYDDDDEEPDYKSQENYKEAEVPEKVPRNKKYCIVKCKRPKFDFYKGDTFSKFEAIPLASRGWQHRKSMGDYFTIYPFSEVNEEDTIDTTGTFNNFGLDTKLLQNIEKMNLFHPTKIQELGIEKILSGSNVALTAETGCGKTYAFLIPMIQQILKWKPLSEDRGVNRPLGIILTPSKELTIQIARVAKELAKDLDINIIKFVGGHTKQILRNPPIGEVDLIIATVGIMNKLVVSNCYRFDQVKHIVLDEADTLLDETFSNVTCQLLTKAPIGSTRNPNSKYPETTQLTLNSATIPQQLHLVLSNIVDPNSIEPVTTGFEHQIRVPQKFLRLNGQEKAMMLLKLVKPKAKNKVPVIVFSNTTESCNFTSLFLKQFGITCVRLHKSMPLEVRKGKIMEFQRGDYHVLTTTDAGARGIDTTVVKDVINFDFPLITAEYIHRCGRVGRIGSPKDCRIYNFISRPLEIVLTSKIEYAAKKMNPIPMVDLIHNKHDEEGQFLHGENVYETEVDADEDKDDDNNNSDDDYDDDDNNNDKKSVKKNKKKFNKYSIPQ